MTRPPPTQKAACGSGGVDPRSRSRTLWRPCPVAVGRLLHASPRRRARPARALARTRGAYAFPQAPPPQPVTRLPTRLARTARVPALAAPKKTPVHARGLSWHASHGPANRAQPAHSPAKPEERSLNPGRMLQERLPACHQPDWRGQDKLAPSLSALPPPSLRADIPFAILLSGSNGLWSDAAGRDRRCPMPESRACCYIRREWGQDGSPVDGATVKQVRTTTADRTRPWKHDELMALIKSK